MNKDTEASEATNHEDDQDSGEQTNLLNGKPSSIKVYLLISNYKGEIVEFEDDFFLTGPKVNLKSLRQKVNGVDK